MKEVQNLFRYCAKCGSTKIIKNSFKSYKCSECSFHFFFNTAAAVVGIIKNEKNEILFTIRKHNPKAGYLDLPGGFVDYNESAEEALRREIKEELGVEIKSSMFYKTCPNTYLYDDILYYTVDLFYFCQLESFNLSANDDVSGFIFKNLNYFNVEELGLNSSKVIISELKLESFGV